MKDPKNPGKSSRFSSRRARPAKVQVDASYENRVMIAATYDICYCDENCLNSVYWFKAGALLPGFLSLVDVFFFGIESVSILLRLTCSELGIGNLPRTRWFLWGWDHRWAVCLGGSSSFALFSFISSTLLHRSISFPGKRYHLVQILLNPSTSKHCLSTVNECAIQCCYWYWNRCLSTSSAFDRSESESGHSCKPSTQVDEWNPTIKWMSRINFLYLNQSISWGTHLRLGALILIFL